MATEKCLGSNTVFGIYHGQELQQHGFTIPWKTTRFNDELGEADSAPGGSTTPMMYASAKNFPNMGAGVFFGCMQCDGLFL